MVVIPGSTLLARLDDEHFTACPASTASADPPAPAWQNLRRRDRWVRVNVRGCCRGWVVKATAVVARVAHSSSELHRLTAGELFLHAAAVPRYALEPCGYPCRHPPWLVMGRAVLSLNT